MVITNRNLAVGTKLVGHYRGRAHSVLVVNNGDGVGFELDNGAIHQSLSSAGRAVMNGIQCNGWRFWSLESDVRQAPPSAVTRRRR